MAIYSISASQLTEGTSVFIRGKLAYARLTRPIEGAELAASDQRKVQNGMSPVGKPHTTATITEAEVQFADPVNPTIEEQFVSERCYASKKNPGTGANYSIDAKGSNLPIIAIPSEAGDGTFDQDTSCQELAQGLDVTLVLRVYKPKNFNNRGLALDQVIVHEAPRYYNAGGVATGELAARGIVFNTPPRAVQAPTGGSAVGAAEDVVGTDVEDSLSFPAPQPAAPAQAQAAQAPVVQPTAVAPVVPAPAAATQAAQPQIQGETPEQKLARLEAENVALKNAGSAVGAPVGAAPENPWNGQGGAGGQQAGITYQG
ncbi:hypothetical protein [Saccharopolyspora hattusasensis]|uniref:hypothetical protein n=1 Tax=Saccharopolyspora hattusasensis TaxID=1128679 RepID=UPI003D96F7F0